MDWPQNRLEEFESWMTATASEPHYDEAWSRLALRVADTDPIRAIEVAKGITDQVLWERITADAAERLIKIVPDTSVGFFCNLAPTIRQ